MRCVNSDGAMIGILPTREAMRLAQEQQLDLVEVSPNADPPVCRIMDFGKYMYDEGIKRKQAKKHHQNRQVKEIKFHVNVADHDYQTKVNHVRKFLDKGHKVKLSLMFRGRENVHRELGFDVMQRVVADCEDVSTVEMPPKLVGQSIVSVLVKHSAKSAKQKTADVSVKQPPAMLRPPPEVVEHAQA